MLRHIKVRAAPENVSLDFWEGLRTTILSIVQLKRWKNNPGGGCGTLMYTYGQVVPKLFKSSNESNEG